MGRKKQIFTYVISDYLAATIAWGLFFLFRKLFIEWLPPDYSILGFIENKTFFLGIIILPVFWIIIHYIDGYYRFIFRKTISEDFIRTLRISVIGVIVLFFTLLLNDIVKNYHTYYITGSVLLGLQFIITLIPRLLITKLNIRKIRKHKRFFNTKIIITISYCAS